MESNDCKHPIVKLGLITPIILHSTEQSQAESAHPQSVSAVPVRQAETDEQLIALWLHGRSKHTQRAYSADTQHFFIFTKKSLRQIKLADIQEFENSLAEQKLEQSSINRTLAAVKSLISFGHRIGYLPFDIGRPVKLTAAKDTLAERILSESEVQLIIASEANPRNRLILKMLYCSAVRISELSNLKWKDLQEREDGGQVTVFGKGNKTHTVLLPQSIWAELAAYRNGSADDMPLFKSRKGNKLCCSQILRIVKKAADRAGISKAVSPHWFRHSHASHALEHNAPIHLVQQTLAHSSVATTGRYLHARPQDSSSRYLNL
jgi:integrase/recombinase XerD